MITEIKIQVQDKTIELSLEEARGLYQDLRQVFGYQADTTPLTYPYKVTCMPNSGDFTPPMNYVTS